MHFEILETRKRNFENEKNKNSEKIPKQPDFVYKEQDFPSIIGGETRRKHRDKEDRHKEGDGKYMWIIPIMDKGNT